MPTKRPTASSKSARFAPWDVVLVPFPYTDRTTQQRRPALIVSKHALEQDHSLTWLVMITSTANRGWAGDVAITDQAKAGLPAPSIIRPTKIATVDTALILRRLGSIAPADRSAVLQTIKRYAL
jgi:mRNA interferase MazF